MSHDESTLDNNDDLASLAHKLCQSVQEWISTAGQADERELSPFACHKEALTRELNAAMQLATNKKERKVLNKDFDRRRLEMEERMRELCRTELPILRQRLLDLHAQLQPLLQSFDLACQSRRNAVQALDTVEDRRRVCRIFYDGTADDAYSNFKPYRFSLGRLGFLKGEQFFHVAKALICQDEESATRMMTTTGGPALRNIGRQVQNYHEHGDEWENIDSGLLLLVCIIIKLAQLQDTTGNASLRNEFASDAEASGSGLIYIAEGAKDDARCGLGIHASNPNIMDEMERWGRNQLGHACMAVVGGWAFS